MVASSAAFLQILEGASACKVFVPLLVVTVTSPPVVAKFGIIIDR